MAINNLFYSIIYVDSKKIPTSFIPNNPFIFTCDFNNKKIIIKQTNKMLKKEIIIHYNEITNTELTICSRFRGAPISMLPTMFYNFNLYICTNKNEYNIEFQANFRFKEVINLFKRNKILFTDKLNIFDMFVDEKTFDTSFYNYFNKNFEALSKKYKLDNPRIGYK